MKKTLCLSFFLTFSNPLQALVIELLEEIKTSPHKGTFSKLRRIKALLRLKSLILKNQDKF